MPSGHTPLQMGSGALDVAQEASAISYKQALDRSEILRKAEEHTDQPHSMVALPRRV